MINEDSFPVTNEEIKRITRNTGRRNAAFEKMPDHRKRVVVAMDVIKQLKAKKLVAKQGSYIKVGFSNEAIEEIKHSEPEKSFQETFAEIPECRVCAKGAIFACTVSRRNQVKNKEVPYNYLDKWTGEKLSPLLGGLFSPEQLRLIELEFEDDDIEFRSHESRITPIMKGMERLTDQDRMIRIMKNIIRNNGTFDPSRD